MLRRYRPIILGALLTAWLAALPRGGSTQPAERRKADFRLNVNLVQGTDQGSGDKFDRQTEKLKAAFDKVNRKFFRGLKEVQQPMLLGEQRKFPIVSDQLEIKVSRKQKDKYPVDLTWKKIDGTEHARMRVHLAPGKLFALQGTPYQQGNLWAVLKIEEGSFYLEPEQGPVPAAPIPPLRGRRVPPVSASP